jgi:phosphoribosylformimino-5-aminoimidazole carboxamide ribotide isomerase
MKFRPCIDLHSGVVKQIVGSTLTDSAPSTPSTTSSTTSPLETNFESEKPASFYADMYKRDKLLGGHVIMLGPNNDAAALSALSTYPNSLQIGGGINADNALSWLSAGASHVIVTSFVFKDGNIDMDNLTKLVEAVGKDKIVLDLSCRKKQSDSTSAASASASPYFVVTDRWQKYTNYVVNAETLTTLSAYCSEFLVHGVENEGKRCGILPDLVTLLSASSIPVTYAGGVSCLRDMDVVNELGGGRVDLTIGSALDCFGGDVKYDDVVKWHNEHNNNNINNDNDK